MSVVVVVDVEAGSVVPNEERRVSGGFESASATLAAGVGIA